MQRSALQALQAVTLAAVLVVAGCGQVADPAAPRADGAGQVSQRALAGAPTPAPASGLSDPLFAGAPAGLAEAPSAAERLARATGWRDAAGDALNWVQLLSFGSRIEGALPGLIWTSSIAGQTFDEYTRRTDRHLFFAPAVDGKGVSTGTIAVLERFRLPYDDEYYGEAAYFDLFLLLPDDTLQAVGGRSMHGKSRHRDFQIYANAAGRVRLSPDGAPEVWIDPAAFGLSHRLLSPLDIFQMADEFSMTRSGDYAAILEKPDEGSALVFQEGTEGSILFRQSLEAEGGFGVYAHTRAIGPVEGDWLRVKVDFFDGDICQIGPDSGAPLRQIEGWMRWRDSQGNWRLDPGIWESC